MLKDVDWIGLAIGLGLLSSFVSCSYKDARDHDHEIWMEEHQPLQPPAAVQGPKAVV